MIPVKEDELEVSIFGPGYGESILVHLGAGKWIIIDSCRDNKTGEAVPLKYLRSMGFEPASAVQLIVATHWHDDHIRGLGRIVEVCMSATFACSMAMRERDFFSMVRRFDLRKAEGVGSGVEEISCVFRHLRESGRSANWAVPNTLLLRSMEAASVSGGTCEVTSLSPAHPEIERFLTRLAAQMPQAGQTARRATAIHPNHVAIALWVDLGSIKLLFGSDLEETADPHTGWSVIVADNRKPTGLASVFKIPHHGSATGHSDEVWRTMVAEDAFAVVTPFRNGSVKLPTLPDLERIVGYRRATFVTGGADVEGRIKRSVEIELATKLLVGGSLATLAEPSLGHVRLRKRFGPDGEWYHATLGGAAKL